MSADEPVAVDATTQDMAKLDRAYQSLMRAELALTLAVGINDAEQQRALLDAARDALRPAVADVVRTLRVLRFRLYVARRGFHRGRAHAKRRLRLR